jgi:hypothetical protein
MNKIFQIKYGEKIMSNRKGSVLGILGLIIGMSGLSLGGYAFISTLNISRQINSSDSVYKARAYRSTSLSIPQAAWTKIDFDFLDYDEGSNFDILNDRFTCPYEGYYLVSGMVTFVWLDVDTAMYVAVIKNDIVWEAASASEASHNDFVSAGVTDIIYLELGDTIDLRVYHTSISTRNVYGSSTGGYTFLTVSLFDD